MEHVPNPSSTPNGRKQNLSRRNIPSVYVVVLFGICGSGYWVWDVVLPTIFSLLGRMGSSFGNNTLCFLLLTTTTTTCPLLYEYDY
jgi:hypothetical protein